MPPNAEAFVDSPAIRTRFVVPTKKTIRPPPSSSSSSSSLDRFICRAVSDFSDDASSTTSSSTSSSSSSNDMISSDSPQKSPRPNIFTRLPQRVFGGGRNLKQKLLEASNFASLLCVLDCTILPIVTVILPLFGIVAASPAQMEALHELGHSVALWFVLPVGGLATTLNYTNHGKLWIAAMGWLGLVAVVGANIGCHGLHLPGAVWGHFLHDVLHALHHGILHRVTNLAGCFLLLTSNYLSRKQGGACQDSTCTHHH